MLAKISIDGLLLQYSRLRSRLQSLEEVPYGHELFEPTFFLVQVVSPGSAQTNMPFRISAGKIDTSRWPYRYIPKLPTTVSIGNLALLRFCKFRKNQTFSYFTSTPCRQTWPRFDVEACGTLSSYGNSMFARLCLQNPWRKTLAPIWRLLADATSTATYP